MWHAQRMLRNLRSRLVLEGRTARRHQDGRIRPNRGQSVPIPCPSRAQSVPIPVAVVWLSRALPPVVWVGQCWESPKT